MNLDDFKGIFDLKGIRNKIFEIKSMYNPNLIANLSKEMYDRYEVRDSMCNDLLNLIEQIEMNNEKVKNFVEKRIKILEEKQKNAQNIEEANYLKIAIEEWKDFLSEEF